MSKNKKIAILTLSITVLITVGLIIPKIAESRIMTNVPADIGEEELMAVVIEDFENAQAGKNIWAVKSTPKKFQSASTEKKLKMKDPVPTLAISKVKGGPNDMGVEEWSLTGLGKKKDFCLGVNFQFRYPGTNSVHLIPPPEMSWKEKQPVLNYSSSLGKKVQEKGIQLPGRAKGISLWVHGRGNPYNLEVWVKDYRGDTHILKLGSINFVGWRPLKAYIPVNVPQEFKSFPQTRVTKIVRLVLRAQTNAHAEELTENTYFFFDQIKVLTDTYEVNFDGSELHKNFKGGGSGTQK